LCEAQTSPAYGTGQTCSTAPGGRIGGK